MHLVGRRVLKCLVQTRKYKPDPQGEMDITSRWIHTARYLIPWWVYINIILFNLYICFHRTMEICNGKYVCFSVSVNEQRQKSSWQGAIQIVDTYLKKIKINKNL